MKFPENKETIPLYSRIASSLRSKILSGQYEPKAKIPSEEELSEYFDVSRITIREALSHLEKEGLVNRHRGKGTFVSEKIPKQKHTIFTSLLDMVNFTLKSRIKPAGMWTLKVGETNIANEIKAFFNLSNDDLIAKIHRVVISNGSPLHLYQNFMLPEMAAHITNKDILRKKAIIPILEEKADLKIGQGEMFIDAIPADPEVAKVLGCQIFDPFVRLQVCIRLADGKPFEIVNYFMRAEHFRFRIDIDTIDFNTEPPVDR